MIKIMKVHSVFGIFIFISLVALYILPSCTLSDINLTTQDPTDEQCEILYLTHTYVNEVEAEYSKDPDNFTPSDQSSQFSHTGYSDGSYWENFYNYKIYDTSGNVIATLNGNVEYNTDGDGVKDIDIKEIAFYENGAITSTHAIHFREDSSGFTAIWMDTRIIKKATVKTYFESKSASA